MMTIAPGLDDTSEIATRIETFGIGWRIDLMSRRLTWLTIAVFISVAITVMVYSRQAHNDQNKASAVMETPAAQPASANASLPASPAAPAAQKAICTLPATQAPDIGGLKVGMKLADVLALFPGSKEDPEVTPDLNRPADPFGSSNIVINPDKYSSKAKFAGVRQIVINLLDGKVSDFNATYNGPEWKHVDEFVTKFAKAANLPSAEDWEPYVGMDNQLKLLKCDGFEVNVFAGGKGGTSNYVIVKDLGAERTLEERRAKAVEKAQREAKP